MEDRELADPADDGDVVTLKDMLKIMKTDIVSSSRRTLFEQLMVFTLSLLVREGVYRDKLKKHDGLNMTKPVQKLFNDEKFRAEYTHALARQICIRAKLPHYVVICGSEYDRTVKYSRRSLMLAYFNPDFIIMLYEIPM